MAKLALYRKYRGASFADVLGQDQVVRALEQAVQSGHTGHAYLLAGPRGTGKTSVARILARSLNCTAEHGRPCGRCPNCLAAANSSLDTVEIDAASNRGIDEIRELRDKINLAPTLGRYRIYIIDEAHMLTEAAFNALLKTLEEPPSHVVFILATTEAHKLPATVISRTQRFNFRALGATELAQLVTSVAGRETITLDAAAAGLIAELAGGSARDALGLLDQLSALGQPIDAELVRRFLGLGDTAVIEALTVALLAGDAPAVAAQIKPALESGTQPSQLSTQLLQSWQQRLRQAVAASDASAPRLIEMITTVLPVTRAPWPALALEAALLSLVVAPPPVQPAAETVAATPAVATKPRPAPEATPRPLPTPSATKAADDQQGSSDDAATLWPKVLAAIKTQNNSLYALICSCEVTITSDQIELVCRFSFHHDRLREAKNRTVIETAIKQSLGPHYRLVTRLDQSAAPPVEAASELVTSALEILGGEVVE